MTDPSLILNADIAEGDIVFVYVPEGTMKDIDELQTELDAHFKGRGVLAIATALEVSFTTMKPPAADEVLWVAVEGGSEKELEETQAQIEEQMEALDPDGDRGGLVIANFEPDWSALSHQELLVAQAHIEALIEYAENRQPTVLVTPPPAQATE